MRNCLSDLKPEFTAALHYGLLQAALGEMRLGKGSPVSSSCACLSHEHVGGFLPWAARGRLPAVPPKPPSPSSLHERRGGGRKRHQISE